MSARLTTEQFIEKAKGVHGDKYDYTNTEYANARTKVELVCSTHGSFWQKPTSHLHGYGCPACGGTAISTTAEFIKKSRGVHGDKYDYTNTEYANARTKVELICSRHGSFWQTPDNHLAGHGCPVCVGVAVPTREEFVAKAMAIHNDQYDYSQVEYVNTRTKINITCKAHGSFWQTPDNHLKGKGCPRCGHRHLTEGLVEDILRKHYPDVITQYPIRCQQYTMRADVYIPSLNMVVEVNGGQHYSPVALWGGEKAFEQQQLRDGDLKAWCEARDVKLCIIDARPYSPVKHPPTQDMILAAIQEAQQ